MIEVDIKKRLGAFSLDVQFEGGEGVTALFGRSGAGKSSIVKAIVGLLRPDAGRIRVGDMVFFDSNVGVDVPVNRRRVGIVFQDGRLFPHMTVRQNLLYGFERAVGEKRISLDAVLGVLDIAPLLERRPVTLSGGERQRVALGRALLSQPQLLLMDEPMASLDEGRKAEALPYFEILNSEFGIPILYVSHDVGEVVRLASDIVLIDAGQVVASGALGEVTARLSLPQGAEGFGSGVVLECRVEASDQEAGLTSLGTPIGRVRVALMDRNVGSRLSIRIAAKDVALALDEPRNISVQNVFRGRVVEIGEYPGYIVRLKLAVGEGFLLSEVTADAARRLGLAAGLEVVALVKSVAIGR
ncbi:MAG: molybdenum ABC transporter ATP-binding protein [Alphaproteobacteria bacterium]|nr:molybdenum ABC transporter ATP-binding protein [Alphaproteobacteria bacterium]